MQHRFMHYSLLLLGIIFIVSLPACWCGPDAGPPGPDLQWSRTFGEGTNTYGSSVQQTADGGYILCGKIKTSSEEGAWLIKTDAEGNQLWDRIFGGERTAFGESAQQTADGGYIVCGTIQSGTGYPDILNSIWLIKTDAEGNILWDKRFASGGNQDAWGNSVQLTTDGGYILCGRSNDHLRLIKTDAEGNTIWDKTFIGQHIDQGNSVQQTSDGGYIVCGRSRPLVHSYIIGKPNVWLIKTDADGNKIWDRMFGGELYAEAAAVRQTTDGGYIMCGIGETEETAGDFGALLIKTDALGNQLWSKVFYDYRGWVVHGYSVQQTADGGYIVCGRSRFYDPWIIRTDADGNKLWEQEVEIKGISDGRSIQQTADGGYIVCGAAHFADSGHVLLFKLAPEATMPPEQ